MNGIIVARKDSLEVSHWIIPSLTPASWLASEDDFVPRDYERCVTPLPAVVCTCGRLLIDER